MKAFRRSIFRYRVILFISILLLGGIKGIESKGERFTNPVLWADVPDPDVIRVGDDYYMVSTTMHLMPGCPVMHSKDLVNWHTIGYVFDKLTDTPRYDLKEGTVYGRGQWATTIRYNDGKFYVLFSPNDDPHRSYMYTTDDPAGKWKLVSRLPHFHDSSMIFDDDGRVYVFSGGGKIRLTELTPDLKSVKENGFDDFVIFPDSTETMLHEGSRAIKHNGKYYVFVISWPKDKPRRQLCYRADNIQGPYEKCVVLESKFGGFGYAGQGCLVDDTDGNWWGMIFQDRGGVGRVLTLNPVTWKEGWPMLGDENGNIPELIKDLPGVPNTTDIISSDDFNGSKSINWQWNHNPVDEAWSVTERPGYLRLKTSEIAPHFYLARNTITQRMPGPLCSGEVKLDVSHMKPGDICGFGAMNGDSGLLSVKMDDKGNKWIVHSTSSARLSDDIKAVTSTEDEELFRAPLDGNDIWMRIDADFNPGKDIAKFYYSIDGNNWNPVGGDYKMIFDFSRMFMGSKFAIYNFATKENGGFIDVDYFHLNP